MSQEITTQAINATLATILMLVGEVASIVVLTGQTNHLRQISVSREETQAFTTTRSRSRGNWTTKDAIYILFLKTPWQCNYDEN